MRSTVTKAPDGGWGWMVVMASFFLQALSVGNTYSFGVIYVELLDYYDETESVTAWIGSLQAALLYLVCVLAGPPLKTCGWRAVAVVGVIISSSGFFLSSIAPHIYVLFFTYGVMTGVGFGMMYTSAIVTVQHYFDKKRSLATGIAVSGSGVGTMTFGVLTGRLLDHYHWTTTVMIEGAINLVIGLVCAAIFRQIPQTEDKDTDETKPIIKRHNACYESIEDTSCEGPCPQLGDSNSNLATSPSRYPDEISPVKVRSDKQYDHKSMESSGTMDVAGQCCCCMCWGSGCEGTFRLSLLKNPVQVMFCLAIVCFSFGYHVPYTFTPERAASYNIESSKCSLLVSIMALTNVVSRIVFGCLGDHIGTLRYWILGMAFLLCGVLNTLICLFTTFPLLVIYCVCFGVCTGCVASMYVVILVDLMGIDVIEYTLGLSLASASVIFLVASPIAGWIIQHTGSYDTAFLSAGVIQVVGSLIYYSISLIRKRWPKYKTVVGADDEHAM